MKTQNKNKKPQSNIKKRKPAIQVFMIDNKPAIFWAQALEDRHVLSKCVDPAKIFKRQINKLGKEDPGYRSRDLVFLDDLYTTPETYKQKSLDTIEAIREAAQQSINALKEVIENTEASTPPAIPQELEQTLKKHTEEAFDLSQNNFEKLEPGQKASEVRKKINSLLASLVQKKADERVASDLQRTKLYTSAAALRKEDPVTYAKYRENEEAYWLIDDINAEFRSKLYVSMYNTFDSILQSFLDLEGKGQTVLDLGLTKSGPSIYAENGQELSYIQKVEIKGYINLLYNVIMIEINAAK
jgi:hypothetical protein